VRAVQQRFGTVAVLVNNAGVILWKAVADHTLEDIETLYRTNAEGAAKIAVAFLPLIQNTLINIGSDIAKAEWFMTGLPLYCVTKSDVRSLSFMLHKACPHLKVYCVNPDRTGTRMNQFEGRAPAQIAEVIFNTALGRYAPGSHRDVDVNTILR
jgi:NADP-dependent 3-hydroxy acid dehydrogenase YdfG